MAYSTFRETAVVVVVVKNAYVADSPKYLSIYLFDRVGFVTGCLRLRYWKDLCGMALGYAAYQFVRAMKG